MISNPIDAIRANFRLKLILSVGLVLFVALSLYVLFFIQQLTRTLDEGLRERGESFANNVGFSAELGVLAGDPTLVEASTVGVLEEEGVVFVAVYNREGHVISSRGILNGRRSLSLALRDDLVEAKGVVHKEMDIDGKKHYDFFAPIILRTTGISGVGEIVGFSRVVLSLEGIRDKQERFVLFYIMVSFAIFLGAGAVIAFFARRITRSVDSLMEGVRNVAKGELGTPLRIESRDEFGRLGGAFNQMTDRLREGKEREQEVSRMKSEFLSITAHQLRTPLSALKWVLNMALEGDVGKLTKTQKELLQKGYNANERMITLVNDLLDVVRIEEGRFDYNMEKGSLLKVIEDLVKEVKIIADQRGVELSLHKPSRKVPDVLLDCTKMHLAINNIVDNAIRYTRPGGQVNMEITVNGEEVLVLVRDTGVGIPKGQLRRVFTKFFRAQNAIRVQPSGSGLGLFIARNIIRKHKGKVWIESEEGKGTSVYFTIPVAK